MKLFPHRYDYIWAPHPRPGQPAQWQTESRHPLSDRAIAQGHYLYGVRFGAETSYAMLDIDVGSPYHPNQDPLAIVRMTEALEPLGLVSYVTVTSSYSGGLHLYFPFEEAQVSWQVALVFATLLENSGFKPYPGQLEIFPNPKPYIVEGNYSLFNAHRLPLQPGSYLLDEDLQPASHSQARFVEYWHYARSKNELDLRLFKRILKQAKQRIYKLSGKADKFLQDLNTEIEAGWTGYGQTNRLLGRITLRTYVFHHILAGGEPLAGDRLLQKVVEIAQSLPGYEDWCRHKHEIHDRVLEWVRCVEKSRYFHYGFNRLENTDRAIDQMTSDCLNSGSEVDRLVQQSAIESPARIRIMNAIADLLNKNELPIQTTDRFKKLLTYGIGGGSLYRHKDLWHPDFLKENSPETKASKTGCKNATSLLPENSGNPLLNQGLSQVCSIAEMHTCGNSLEDGQDCVPIDPVSTMGTTRSIAVLSNQVPEPTDLDPSSPASEPLEPLQTLRTQSAAAIPLRSRFQAVVWWLRQYWSNQKLASQKPASANLGFNPSPTPRTIQPNPIDDPLGRLSGYPRSFLEELEDPIAQNSFPLETLWQRFCMAIVTANSPNHSP